MPREAAICRTIMKHLSQRPDVWVEKRWGSAVTRVGVPDIMFIERGATFFFEVKRPGEKPTKIQQRCIDQLRRAGVVAAVVHSVDEVRKVLAPFDF